MTKNNLGITDKAIKTAGDKLFRGIYFNKKYRKGLKDDFTSLQNSCLATVLAFHSPKSIKDANDKLLAEQMMDVATNYLETIKKAEKYYPRTSQYGIFKLYKTGNNFVFAMQIIRDGKIKPSQLNFGSNLYNKAGKTVKMIKRKFASKELQPLDSGKHHFKQSDFTKVTYTFWGQKRKYRFKLKGNAINSRTFKFKLVTKL